VRNAVNDFQQIIKSKLEEYSGTIRQPLYHALSNEIEARVPIWYGKDHRPS